MGPGWGAEQGAGGLCTGLGWPFLTPSGNNLMNGEVLQSLQQRRGQWYAASARSSKAVWQPEVHRFGHLGDLGCGAFQQATSKFCMKSLAVPTPVSLWKQFWSVSIKDKRRSKTKCRERAELSCLPCEAGRLQGFGRSLFSDMHFTVCLLFGTS